MEQDMISCHRAIDMTAPQAKAITVARRFGKPLGGALSIMVLALLSCQAASVSAQQAASKASVTPEVAKKFPDGRGKDTFLRVCSSCHSPMNVLASGQTRQGWEDTITKMAGYGAVASDEDFTAVLDYLEKNFPPQQKVDINKATAAQMEKALQLEPTAAEAIVAYRDKHGDFKSLDDLKQVPGVDTATLDAKKALITFD
jgi:competence protein ComEA